VKARAFKYVRVSSADEALQAFHGAKDACYLSGGQSLVPSLSLRLQAPDLLIDISRIDAFKGIQVRDDRLRIGALTRHVDVLKSAEIARFAPLLKQAAAHVAHPAIRNKGTIGGSIAQADPAAEFPAMMLALDAEIEVIGTLGSRRIKADQFFHGLYETALRPGEILSAVHLPLFGPAHRCAFDELARRLGDFAIVGAGVQAIFDGEIVQSARIAFFSVGPTPMRAKNAEAAIAGRLLNTESISAAQAALSQDLDPSDDFQTTSGTRLHLARVLLSRVLGRLKGPTDTGAETHR
jgi:carbon-monoxide dehydrogenase medium subunit